MDTYYRERAGEAWQYWAYVAGLRLTFSARFVRREVARGMARIVTVLAS